MREPPTTLLEDNTNTSDSDAQKFELEFDRFDYLGIGQHAFMDAADEDYAQCLRMLEFRRLTMLFDLTKIFPIENAPDDNIRGAAR